MKVSVMGDKIRIVVGSIPPMGAFVGAGGAKPVTFQFDDGTLEESFYHH